jgi:hypothetical protein
MSDLVPILGVVFGLGAPALVIIMISKLRHEQQMEMIKKGINPNLSMQNYPGQRNLLRGLILTALGLGAVISTIINSNTTLMHFGIIFLAAGIAFLVYWKVTAADRERERNLYEEYISKELAKSNSGTVSPSAEGPSTVSNRQAM